MDVYSCSFSCNSHGILVWKPENAILGSGQKRMCACFPSVLDSCEILAKLVAILEVVPWFCSLIWMLDLTYLPLTKLELCKPNLSPLREDKYSKGENT